MKPLDSPELILQWTLGTPLYPEPLIFALTLSKHEEIDVFWVMLFSASQTGRL